MGFKRVKFNNFRNIEPHEIHWSGGLNLLTGPNGSGKTNILEGINILSGWGPLEHGTKTKSLPKWNSGSTVVQLTGQLDGDIGEIIQVRIAERYAIRIHDKTISATELRWKNPVLTFLPNDIALLEGSASYRRRLLDMLLALLIPPYAMRLHDYRRGIKQKTFMLRRGERTEVVDRALLPLAAWIWKMRKETVTLLSSCLNELKALVPEEMTLTLKRGGGGHEEGEEDDFRIGLASYSEREKAMKVPFVGPHRDDMVISCGERNASDSLSRGYRRRAAIALMLAASDGVLRKLGKVPVLLLDEVTAELDSDGRKLLFGALADRKAQVFAATAEPFAETFSGTVYSVNNGMLEKTDENK
jgi:DNA replication and repair protein RecF